MSLTTATNVRLEGNTAHQFLTGHAPVTKLSNAVIVAHAGTEPVNVTNAQDTRTEFDNVRVVSPAGQKVLFVPGSTFVGRRVTCVGPAWENAGVVRLTESVIGGGAVRGAGDWTGSRNVYDPAVTPPPGETTPGRQVVTPAALARPGQPFPGAGANPAEVAIPPRPVPHPAAGRFEYLRPIAD